MKIKIKIIFKKIIFSFYDKILYGDVLMYFKIQNGSLTLGKNAILENINFVVKDHEKIGIVGRNGAGKSSLLKAIIGEYQLEDGYDKLIIENSHDFKIGYVKQNNLEDPNMKMVDYIKSAYPKIIFLEKKLQELEEKMSNNYEENIINEYNQCLLDYEYQGGYKYQKEYENALKKFGFSSLDKDKKLKDFSGGQLTRISLIKLLLSKPDLLILDEPTNHLDISSIEWLEEYLVNYKNSLIIVSHDRMFMDKICNVIYYIEYGFLTRYTGNYSSFIKQREINYQKELKDYEFQQKEIKRLTQVIERFRYKPTKAKMAMSRLKQIEKMNIIEKPVTFDNRTFRMKMKPLQNSYREVLKVKDLSIGYDNNVLCKLSLKLERGDKLGIIGENGSGKSTLVKTLIGQINSLGGKATFGENTNIGYFSQQLENLNKNNTVYDEIANAFPLMSSSEIRNLLGAFEFRGDSVFTKIENLSGGERVRVSLCKILYTNPNVLILDEPTNHLDIINKDTIEKMLKDYLGTLIIVSHDRYLINRVCNKLLVLENKEGHFYNYGYKEYLEKRELNKNVSSLNLKKKEPSKEILPYNLKKEINKIENNLDKLTKNLQDLNGELLKEEVYLDANKYKKIEEEIENVNKKIEENTNKWYFLTKDM